MWAFLGSRTTRERNARGVGITVCRFDPQDGSLAPVAGRAVHAGVRVFF